MFVALLAGAFFCQPRRDLRWSSSGCRGVPGNRCLRDHHNHDAATCSLIQENHHALNIAVLSRRTDPDHHSDCLADVTSSRHLPAPLLSQIEAAFLLFGCPSSENRPSGSTSAPTFNVVLPGRRNTVDKKRKANGNWWRCSKAGVRRPKFSRRCPAARSRIGCWRTGSVPMRTLRCVSGTPARSRPYFFF